MATKEKDKSQKEKTVKKNEKQVEKKKATKNVVKKELGIKKWFKEVIAEFKKVRWPSKKEMIKYSIATIAFILFFALFFYLIEIIIYFIKEVA